MISEHGDGITRLERSNLHQPFRELLETRIELGLDDETMVLDFTEVKRLLDHFRVFGKAGVELL
jgi:hypothetical protein